LPRCRPASEEEAWFRGNDRERSLSISLKDHAGRNSGPRLPPGRERAPPQEQGSRSGNGFAWWRLSSSIGSNKSNLSPSQGIKPPHRVNAASDDAEGSGIGPAPLRERLLSGARSGKQGRHAKVPLVTAGLGVESIRLVVLQVEFLLYSPRSCPGGGI